MKTLLIGLLFFSIAVYSPTFSNENYEIAQRHYQQSESYKKSGQLERSLVEAQLAVKAQPNNGFYNAHLANLYSDLKNFTQALQYYKLAWQNGYQEPWIILAQALTLRNLEQFDDCIRMLEKAHQENNSYSGFRENLPYSYVLRAKNYQKVNKIKEAHADFERAYRLLESADWTLFYYAMSHAEIGNRDQAINLLQLGFKKHPHYEWFKPNLASQLALRAKDNFQLKKFDQALSDIRTAYEMQQPQDWVLFYHVAILAELKRYDEVLRLSKLGDSLFTDKGYTTFRDNLPYYYHQATSHYISEKDKNKVFSLVKDTGEVILNISTTADFQTYQLILQAHFDGINFLKDHSIFTSSLKKIESKLMHNAHVLESLGWAVFNFYEVAEKKTEQTVFDEIIRLRRQAMTIYEKQNPPKNILKNLEFPLKGLFIIATAFDGNVWSHVGLQGKYCYDMMHVNAQGSTIKKNAQGNQNSDYETFGQTLYAVIDGTIKDANDDQIDQIPGVSQKAGNQLTLIDQNGNQFWYIHLKHKSLKVKAGDRVKKGQPLAQIGNTGPSGGPHLHFCAADKNAVTIPFRFKSAKVYESGLEKKPKITNEPYKKNAIIETK